MTGGTGTDAGSGRMTSRTFKRSGPMEGSGAGLRYDGVDDPLHAAVARAARCWRWLRAAWFSLTAGRRCFQAVMVSQATPS